jgi:hypothetical protein
LDATGVIWLDHLTGVLRDRATGTALDRARAEYVLGRAGPDSSVG